MPVVAEPSVVEFLRHLSLFSGISEEELERLVRMGQQVLLPPRGVLIREGEPGDALYVVLEGDFEITKHSGSSEVVIAHRGAGEVMGEMSLLDNEPRSATVRALTPSRLLKIDQESFHKLLEWSPPAARAILKTVTSRLRNTEAMLRQSEKMAALGTLAAGVAHELNNPAAAVGRASAQLGTRLREVEQLEMAFNALPLDPARRTAFAEWRAWVEQDAAKAPQLDPLARADLESQVQEWLEAHQVQEAWEVAPRLVGLGFDSARLDELVSMFSADQLPPVLTWLAARGNVEALLNEVASSAERISTIVKAIKSYSYLDQAPVQEVDVHAGLEDTLVILRYKLKQGITVKREYARDLPKIQAYASELNQVWTNIVDNAIDAMKGQGALRIRTFAEGDRVLVEICDNGPGIPEEIQARIFDPFFTTKPVGSGTGLGLHISYNIVVLKHQGQITVESRPGETCFKVALPVTLTPDRRSFDSAQDGPATADR
jgi:signal transduction histidine kinase